MWVKYVLTDNSVHIYIASRHFRRCYWCALFFFKMMEQKSQSLHLLMWRKSQITFTEHWIFLQNLCMSTRQSQKYIVPIFVDTYLEIEYVFIVVSVRVFIGVYVVLCLAIIKKTSCKELLLGKFISIFSLGPVTIFPRNRSQLQHSNNMHAWSPRMRKGSMRFHRRIFQNSKHL